MTKLWKHQTAALKVAKGKRGFAYLMAMRTGKTAVVIAEAEELMRKGSITGLAVVAPHGVHRLWLQQWAEHSAMKGSASVHAWEGGTTKRELARLAGLRSVSARAVFAINYDALITARGKAALEAFLKAHDSMLVLDEAHRIKSPGAKRSRVADRLGKLGKYRRILTGTPVANSPLDVYMPFHFLNPDILGHPNFWSFRARYAVLKQRQLGPHAKPFMEVTGFQHLDELKRLIAPHSYSITAEECLDLPPRQYVRLPVELSPQQRKLYQELTDELITRLDGQEMSAPLALTQLMRLQQLLSGWFVPDQQGEQEQHGRWLTDERLPREKALLEYLEDVPGKVIIWCRFVPERERLVQMFRTLTRNYKTAEWIVDGKTAGTAIEFWRVQDDCRYLIASPEGPAAEGVDLSAADTEVYYSNSFRLTARQQSEARPEKKGRRVPVTVVDLEAPGTVDTKILEALHAKQDLARSFSGARLREWLT